MEQIAAETWRDAIDEVVEAAQHDQALRQRAQAQPPEAVANAEDSEAVQAEPAASVAPVFPQQAQQVASAPTDLPPVAPQEFAQALRPAHDGGTTAAPTVASSIRHLWHPPEGQRCEADLLCLKRCFELV